MRVLQGLWRRIALWLAAAVATVVFVTLSALTALWFSVGGTFFRGRGVTIVTAFQMGLAVLCCIGLIYVIRELTRAATRP